RSKAESAPPAPAGRRRARSPGPAQCPADARATVADASVAGRAARASDGSRSPRASAGSGRSSGACASSVPSAGEQPVEVFEALELQGIAEGVQEEHRALLAGLPFEADVRLDDELHVGRLQQ